MKILILGDPHFKKGNLYIMNFACQEIIEIIDKTQPDLCICLGDTLDTHERVTLRPLHMATRLFFSISERCPLVVIIGNHDRENNSDFCTDIHPFIGLIRTKNIQIVDDTYWDKERNFIYVPYVFPGRFQEALQRVNYSPENSEHHPKIIFAHQEFSGSDMNNGVLSTKGDPWLKEWPLVISGHIHEHQTLSQVVYAGTFIQQNYGESPNKALLMLYLDEESNESTEILKDSDYRIERIPLESILSRQTVHLNLDQLNNFTQYIPNNSVRSQDLKDTELTGHGVLVRVCLHVDSTETKSLKTNPSYVALEKMVDKVNVIVENHKTSLAMNMIQQAQNQGEKSLNISLETVVQELLKEDTETLNLFRQEILQ